jgi:hypothetical protein
MFSNRYDKNAAKCARLARESGDSVLSFGLLRMADAWLELAKNRREGDVRQTSAHTRSHRGRWRMRSSSRGVVSHRKGGAKVAGEKRHA